MSLEKLYNWQATIREMLSGLRYWQSFGVSRVQSGDSLSAAECAE